MTGEKNVGVDPFDWLRLRVEYGKRGRLAFLGHLEVLSTIDRSVRRSGLPYAVSSGFAERTKMQFSSALPVGASSDSEFFDLMLTRHVDEGEALEALGASMPMLMAPVRCGYKPRVCPALDSWLDRSAWAVTIPRCPLAPEALDAAIGDVHRTGTIEYMRKDKVKRIDLSRTLLSWASRREGEALIVDVITAQTEGAHLRPGLLVDRALQLAGDERDRGRDGLSAVGVPPTLKVKRTRQWHDEDGLPVEAL